MSHVTGIATITIEPDGRRIVTTRDLQVNPNPKPLTLEASGSDVEMWREKIRKDVPGMYETVAHFGGATALLVPRRAIALPDPNFLAPMVEEFGELGEDVLLGAVRTGSAAATKNCVDTTGAMATTLDLEGDTLKAIAKILVFRSGGWVRMVLRAGAQWQTYQESFDAVQRQRWEVVRPGFAQSQDALLTFTPVGQDRWNGRPTNVVFGPLGDTQYVDVVRLELDGEGFRFRDGEWREGQRAINQRRPDMVEFRDETVPALLPLHRQIVATTTVAKHPGKPLILQLDASGQLHPGGLHVFVDGILNRRLLSHNPARVLGPHGLGWLA